MPRPFVTRLLVALPLLAALVTTTIYVESKASSGRVDALEARVRADVEALATRQLADEIARARNDERMSWMMSAIWATAQRVGAPVPPPPTP
jgi:hypothetical protein